MPELDIHQATALIHQLTRGIKEARDVVAEVAARLDITNVGHSKWTLMRCADRIQEVLRRTGMEADPQN